MTIAGYVELESDLWAPGVLERALEKFMQGDSPPLVFAYDPAKVLGTVTRIRGNGSRVEITAKLEEPPPRTVAKDAYRKIKSGTLKGLALAGDFTRGARIDAVVVTAIPVEGSGYIEQVTT